MHRSKANLRDREAFTRFIERLEICPPKELDRELEAHGYRGQGYARRAMCLMAYRHIRRILRLHRDGHAAETVPAKANYLLLGPTGCGKTYLTELLFEEILRIPTVSVDITAYSETGYVGQDTNAILTRLLNRCGGNPLLAQVAIVCLDEFDKLSSGGNSTVFSGAGTTKDVTGRGVQRELLKMLEGADVEAPVELTHSSYAERVVISTRDLAFVACGAFSGLKSLTRSFGSEPDIGFGRTAASALRPGAIAVGMDLAEVEKTAHFQAYGFMPELIGRFARVVPFEPLSAETLTKILDDNIVSRFESEFTDEGLELIIDDEVKAAIVTENLEKETGARGLASVLTRHLEEAAFEAFGSNGAGRVRLQIVNGGVVARVD